MPGTRKGARLALAGARQGNLPTKLETLEPLNGFTLVGDDLCLPHQGNRHETHGDDAERQDDTHGRFRGRNVKLASKPCHSKGSPSTRSAEVPHSSRATERANV